MEEAGLAQQSAGMGQMGVREVVQMLMQGMSPEELVKQGVPAELVQAAMQMLMKQMPPQDSQSGLANTVVQPEKY